jgi:hypothetical protein
MGTFKAPAIKQSSSPASSNIWNLFGLLYIWTVKAESRIKLSWRAYISLDGDKVKKVDIANVPSLNISLIAFGISFSSFFFSGCYYDCYYSFCDSWAYLIACLTFGFFIFTLICSRMAGSGFQPTSCRSRTRYGQSRNRCYSPQRHSFFLDISSYNCPWKIVENADWFSWYFSIPRYRL